MLSLNKKDQISWFMLITIVLMFIEIVYYDFELVFPLFISIMMIYFGRQKMPKRSGKFMFWLGIIIFISTFMNMITLKIMLFIILISILNDFYKSKKEPKLIKPIIDEPKQIDMSETELFVYHTPLLKNKLFGHQETPEHVYEWNDINIQTGIGDAVIDFSNTILPNGETVVFIRNFIGNIQIYIPYDIEVSVHHSVLLGSTKVFSHEEKSIYNQNLFVQTNDYQIAEQKIKVFISMLVGDLEVKRK